MISAGDFRNGVTFEMDGQVVSIIEFQHVKPGKGAAFVRTKIRNVITGAVVEKTFNPNNKYPTAFIDRKDMEYSYSDGDLYYFMDTETWEQIPINKAFSVTTLSLLRKIWCARFFLTRAMYSALSLRTLLNLRLQRQIPALRVTQQPTLQSLQLLKQVLKLKFLSLLMRAKLFRSTQEQANIWAEHNFCGRISYESY